MKYGWRWVFAAALVVVIASQAIAVCGDVDGDSQVDVNDVKALAAVIAAAGDCGPNKRACDIVKDDVIDIQDLARLGAELIGILIVHDLGIGSTWLDTPIVTPHSILALAALRRRRRRSEASIEPEDGLPAAGRLHITVSDLERGCAAFERHQGRDSPYCVATGLVDLWWGRYADMVDALTVMLVTGDRGLYRDGLFDQGKLEACLQRNWQLIAGFRPRDITSLTAADRTPVRALFGALLAALQVQSGKYAGKTSPVAVARTLHLLAPQFFPLWDRPIAIQYGCRYDRFPAAAIYLRFCEIVRAMVIELSPHVPQSSKSLLKQIDEFNHAKFVMGWIS